MTPPNPWHQRLAQVHDAQSLAELVNAFLASWSAEELRALPVGCAPGHVEDGRDIKRWAVHLSEVYCDAKAETSQEHRRMLAFFMAALERQSQLANRRNEGARALKDLFSDDSRPTLFQPTDF